MANEEAKAMLDALMGGDRNAPLPKGAAVPLSKKRKALSGNNNDGGMLLLPGKRSKSCFDKDIDPLYTAWGIDVYDLFVNTKSDLGANPYIVDEGARQEYLKLSPSEQARLGFEYFLFQKLQELVAQCDRVVHRNEEKLKQELRRRSTKSSSSSTRDFVEDVDETEVQTLVRNMIQAEDMTLDLNGKLKELEQVSQEEKENKQQLEPLLEKQAKEKETKEEKDEEEPSETKVKQEETKIKTEDGANEAEEPSETKVKVKERKVKIEDSENGADMGKNLQELQTTLGQLTMKRQRLVFSIADLVSHLASIRSAIEHQRRNLDMLRSDTTTDKTVCHVSGNFMSSRDADERIAAHYAGKQYVGWKLVRDKLQELLQKYGRYGPPPPTSRGPAGSPHEPPGGGMRGSFSRGGGGSWNSNSRPGGRGRGRYDGGGGSGYRGGGPDRGGRWERQGGGGRGGGGWRR